MRQRREVLSVGGRLPKEMSDGGKVLSNTIKIEEAKERSIGDQADGEMDGDVFEALRRDQR